MWLPYSQLSTMGPCRCGHFNLLHYSGARRGPGEGLAPRWCPCGKQGTLWSNLCGACVRGPGGLRLCAVPSVRGLPPLSPLPFFAGAEGRAAVLAPGGRSTWRLGEGDLFAALPSGPLARLSRFNPGSRTGEPWRGQRPTRGPTLLPQKLGHRVDVAALSPSPALLSCSPQGPSLWLTPQGHSRPAL